MRETKDKGTNGEDNLNPGGWGARLKGCTCPEMDNAYGYGLGDGMFWINETCPLHGIHTEQKEEAEES